MWNKKKVSSMVLREIFSATSKKLYLIFFMHIHVYKFPVKEILNYYCITQKYIFIILYNFFNFFNDTSTNSTKSFFLSHKAAAINLGMLEMFSMIHTWKALANPCRKSSKEVMINTDLQILLKIDFVLWLQSSYLHSASK